MLKRLDKTNIFKIIFSALAAISFVLLFSYSTSPLYKEYYGGDSAQFQTVGKIWADGGAPYKDAFDHKGPIIFLMNKIGYMLVGDKAGVAIVQIVCIFVSLLMIFKICKLASNKLFYGVIGIIISLIFLKIFYFEGNITEEYCLPFITISFYGLVKFFTQIKNKKKTEHPPIWAAIYGVCFGVCLMSQATNALPIGIGVLVITACLVKEKKWKNLLKNICYCAIGTTAVVLPFVIYFSVNGLLGEFLYCTIGYNINYASHIGSWVKNSKPDIFVFMAPVLFPTYMLFMAAYLAWKRKKNLYSIFLAICGAMEMIWFCSGEAYPQYEMITVPQVAILLNELLLTKKNDEMKILQTLLLATVAIVCFGQIQTILSTVPEKYHYYNYQSDEQREVKELVDSIPEEEKNSFIAYGGNELKDVYLRNRLVPHYKYFVIQDWHSSFSNEVKKDVHDTFSQGDAKWLLTEDGNAEVIEDVIESRYNLIDKQGTFSLYKLTEEQ